MVKRSCYRNLGCFVLNELVGVMSRLDGFWAVGNRLLGNRGKELGSRYWAIGSRGKVGFHNKCYALHNNCYVVEESQ